MARNSSMCPPFRHTNSEGRGLRQIVCANSATERPAGHGLGFVGDVDWACLQFYGHDDKIEQVHGC
jgi:hypothetical protein